MAARQVHRFEIEIATTAEPSHVERLMTRLMHQLSNEIGDPQRHARMARFVRVVKWDDHPALPKQRPSDPHL